MNKIYNNLINEKSPYLIQHSLNPVNWYPWGGNAFEKAKTEDKPIFLSIGYSTCHWCHVMEKESFEDKEVAKILNDKFICIKVDREERPDIDSVYMNICQAMTGHGGWPLSIFAMPDGKAFFAGTYFSKEDRYGMTGFKALLIRIAELWNFKREKIIELSQNIHDNLNSYDQFKKMEISPDILHEAYKDLLNRYDEKYGGFSQAPKFPSPHNIMFLLRYWLVYKEDKVLEMVKNTLVKMYEGGIFDHIGFGFSRYSTDEKWLVPHFEKMLYDNALLTICYIETYQVTKDEIFKIIATKVLTYILREMTSYEGAFYSAYDADSEGEEGKFYVWSKSEIEEVLGKEAGEQFCKIFGVTNEGNFEGKNILNLIDQPKDISYEFIEQCRKSLFDYRKSRVHPFCDDKILTSWNGLMIVAFAMATRCFDNEKYLDIALGAINFIYLNMFDETGRLYTRFREGERAHIAYIDDYAFLSWALLEIFNSTFKKEYLDKAIKLSYEMIRLFWDEQGLGFYQYGSDAEKLITRPKEIYDGAIPSGNSVASLVFYKLYKITGNNEWENKLNDIFIGFSKPISHFPSGYTFLLSSYLASVSESKDIIIVDYANSDSIKNIIKQMNEKFLPFDQVIYQSRSNLSLRDIIPSLSNYEMIENRPTAYVCKNHECLPPLTNLNDINEVLSNRN